jgi:hypothetical protein
MNAIEKGFRSEMSQIETERLDEELPKILAGKMTRFVTWLIRDYAAHPFRFEIGEFDIWDDKTNIVYFPKLYSWWLTNVDGK